MSVKKSNKDEVANKNKDKDKDKTSKSHSDVKTKKNNKKNQDDNSKKHIDICCSFCHGDGDGYPLVTSMKSPVTICCDCAHFASQQFDQVQGIYGDLFANQLKKQKFANKRNKANPKEDFQGFSIEELYDEFENCDTYKDNIEHIKEFVKNGNSSIKKYFDDYIVGHDNAKKRLAVAVSTHYKRLILSGQEKSVTKNNIMIIGPTGSGKTLFAQSIAEMVHVPMVIVDATSYTEAGFAGGNVEDIIERLFIKSGGDKDACEQGIIYIDEIDKIAAKFSSGSDRKDPSGAGVQSALLKVIEGNQITITSKRYECQVDIDTSKILFICGGAFSDLRAEKASCKQVGFNGEIKTKNDFHFDQSTLMKYGMSPEFMGRFPVIIPLDELTKSDLVGVLTTPKNSLLEQYKEIFKIDGVNLKMDEPVYSYIANICMNKKIGARGLRSAIDDIIFPFLYDAPDMSKKYNVVEFKCVDGHIKGDWNTSSDSTTGNDMGLKKMKNGKVKKCKKSDCSVLKKTI